MKFPKISIFLYNFLFLKTLEREIYICSEKDLADFQCLDQSYLGTNIINFLTKCKRGKMCQILSTSKLNNNIGMCVSKIEKLMHSEPCRRDIQCSSNECKMKRCSGYSLNRKCDPNRFQCLKGLICSYDNNLKYNSCQKPKNKYDNCNNNLECPLGTICSISSIDNYKDKKCIEIASVKIGEIANDKLVCESGDLYNNICVRKGKIINNCGYNGNDKDKCDIEVIYNNNNIIVEKVNCLISSLGAYYCPNNTIENNFLKYINVYKKKLNKINQDDFLIERFRFTLNNFEVSKTFFEYNYWNLIIDADDCAYQYFFTINISRRIKFSILCFLIIFVIY